MVEKTWTREAALAQTVKGEWLAAMTVRSCSKESPPFQVTFTNDTTRDVVGVVLEKQGQLEEAMAMLKRALAIQEKAYGPDHAEVAITLTDMGVVLEKQGQFEEATATYKRALAIKEKAAS